MKRNIVIGIAATSLLGAAAYAQIPQDKPDGIKAASHGGGKCASGKCGTEKIYAQQKDQTHPDGTLVRARDGKCGLTGRGYKATATDRDRLADGVCGS
ncbi:MAG: hypothetical protein V4610_17735 [Pseudomonadota bacterium]|jgi:uncharacterized low-complexity protein